eukprot:89859_1
MSPLFQALFSYLIANKIHTMYTLIPLIPVCLGVAITSNAELNLTMMALIVSLSSIVISALKGVLSMKILQQDLKTKLQEYSFLVLVTPMASLWVSIFYVIYFYFYQQGDDDEDDTDAKTETFSNFSLELIIFLSIGGCMAFAVNVASIGTVKRTSATSMGVMANLKQ